VGYEIAPWALDVLKVFIGPLAGAFAGAMTAQGIAKRNAGTQRQLDELRATNTAVSAASAVVATAAALKQQHVRPMKQAYDKLCVERDAAQQAGGVFHFPADLETLPPFRTAAPLLEKLLYERISPGRGVLGLLSIVVQSVGGVDDAIQDRNAIAAALKARMPVQANDLAEIYFGLVTEHGSTDLSFPNSLESLVHNVDCIILYGCVLATELAKHAEGLAHNHKDFPPAEKVDFARLAKADLIPEADEIDRAAFQNLNVIPDLP